jgi:choline dehydrogenase-like flavoprotein
MAVAHGAEVRARCLVTTIETGPDGRVTGVVYRRERDDGPPAEERQRCRALVLAAGAVETPRLLLTNGLANGSGQVGRNFMVHLGLQLWGTFGEAVRPYKGIPGALISQDPHRPPGADFAGGYLVQSIGVMPVTHASQVARGRGLWGRALRDHLRGYPHAAGINMLGDCVPSPDNRVELSDERDGRGLPKPRVHFSLSENDRRMTAHAERLLRAVWAAAGARDVWAYQRTAHLIGTCRMGTDAGASAVDPDGRSHEVPNLWVSDNSTFPSALAANPALTIMALALRTADRMLSRR